MAGGRVPQCRKGGGRDGGGAALPCQVAFLLHNSFAEPRRELVEQPFELSEMGWGEFEIAVQAPSPPPPPFTPNPTPPPRSPLFRLQRISHVPETLLLDRLKPGACISADPSPRC